LLPDPFGLPVRAKLAQAENKLIGQYRLLAVQQQPPNHGRIGSAADMAHKSFILAVPV
jgi:hypothetical protein